MSRSSMNMNYSRAARFIASLVVAVLGVACDDKEPGIQRATVESGEELSAGANLTTFDFSENAFGKESKNLSTSQFTDFVVGNSLFRTNWVTAPSSVASLDGVGPIMNAISCGSCHFKDGRARPPQFDGESVNGLLLRLSVPGADVRNAPLPDPTYGGQFQDMSIINVKEEGRIAISYENIEGVYDDGTRYVLRKPLYALEQLNYGALHPEVMHSPRIAMQIPGLGLLENVSEQTILSFADEHDRNGDGISGRPNYVWDVKSQNTVLGRFGWKANQPSIIQQTAGAFNGDMGITTSLFPQNDLGEGQKTEYVSVPNGGDPEIDEEQLHRIVFYIQTLAVPARRNYDNEVVLRGKYLFSSLACDACHVPKMQTGNSSDITVLNGQLIRPYTDMLLHDMGDDLADNRPDFLANGNEWRTPPLWGLGMIKTVNNHTFLLHDGRARTMEEAILWHGGEGQTSKDHFKKLSKEDREALIKFLESL